MPFLMCWSLYLYIYILLVWWGLMIRGCGMLWMLGLWISSREETSCWLNINSLGVKYEP